MSNENVEQVVVLLRSEFPTSNVTFTPDGTGGGTVIIEPVNLGDRYVPVHTWLGAHLNNALPFADVYPLFIGGDVLRKNGAAHQTPISAGHTFENRSALQISKRTNNLLATADCAALKFIKVLHYIRELAP